MIKVGECQICGKYGQLSFEHIPPRKAFNNRSVIGTTFDKAVDLLPGEKIKEGYISQKGIGAYSICQKCNNDTGSWYGERFVKYCHQSMEILQKAGGKPSLFYPCYIYPLSILKQIVAMFMSSVHGLSASNPDLTKFVLKREQKNIPDKFRFFIYYNIEGNLRGTGLVSKCDATGRNKPIIMSEISFPPFGYLMTLDSVSPDKRLLDITYFAKCNYHNRIRIMQNLPVLPTHYILPGDYRSKNEILEAYKKNIKLKYKK